MRRDRTSERELGAKPREVMSTESTTPQPASASASCSVSGDMTDNPEYQAWVESMAKHCRCACDCPCAGVLAGGLCDDIQDDERDSIFDAEEDV